MYLINTSVKSIYHTTLQYPRKHSILHLLLVLSDSDSQVFSVPRMH